MLDGIQNVGAFVGPVKQGVEHQAAQQDASSPAELAAKGEHRESTSSAIYYSPTVQIDPEANVAIFVVRNSETGAVINQFPSKQVVEEYKRADAKKDAEIHHHAENAKAHAPAVEAKKAEAAPAKAPPAPAPAPEVKVSEAKPEPEPPKETA